MKTTQITLKCWANTSNEIFIGNFRAIESKLLKNGFKQLNTAFDTLRGKKATEKVIIYAWYWRGEWTDKTKGVYTIFYK